MSARFWNIVAGAVLLIGVGAMSFGAGLRSGRRDLPALIQSDRQILIDTANILRQLRSETALPQH